MKYIFLFVSLAAVIVTMFADRNPEYVCKVVGHANSKPFYTLSGLYLRICPRCKAPIYICRS
jgi:hypothetical protein